MGLNGDGGAAAGLHAGGVPAMDADAAEGAGAHVEALVPPLPLFKLPQSGAPASAAGASPPRPSCAGAELGNRGGVDSAGAARAAAQGEARSEDGAGASLAPGDALSGAGHPVLASAGLAHAHVPAAESPSAAAAVEEGVGLELVVNGALAASPGSERMHGDTVGDMGAWQGVGVDAAGQGPGAASRDAAAGALEEFPGQQARPLKLRLKLAAQGGSPGGSGAGPSGRVEQL